MKDEDVFGFEMANGESPEEIVKATQAVVLNTLKGVMLGLKDDFKQPGLTWEQIELIIEEFKRKKVTIIKQDLPG
jgi:signal recognition particle subunit SEC65